MRTPIATVSGFRTESSFFSQPNWSSSSRAKRDTRRLPESLGEKEERRKEQGPELKPGQ